MADGAAPGLPQLVSSLPTTQSSTTTDVTGTTTGTPIFTVTTNFGPGTIVVGPVDTAPINFTLLAGQVDTNVNTSTVTTVDRTVTTTTTNLLTQTYDIVGTPNRAGAAPAVPEPAPIALLALGLLPVGLLAAHKRRG